MEAGSTATQPAQKQGTVWAQALISQALTCSMCHVTQYNLLKMKMKMKMDPTLAYEMASVSCH